jgi:hypothetical protein
LQETLFLSVDELGPTLEYLQSAERKLLAEVKDFDLNTIRRMAAGQPGRR